MAAIVKRSKKKKEKILFFSIESIKGVKQQMKEELIGSNGAKQNQTKPNERQRKQKKREQNGM